MCVKINPYQPLVAGIRTRLPTGVWVTLGVHYEALSPDCFHCGEMDHVSFEQNHHNLEREECLYDPPSCVKEYYAGGLVVKAPVGNHWVQDE